MVRVEELRQSARIMKQCVAQMPEGPGLAAAVVFAATRPPHVQLDWLRLGPA